MRTTLLRTAALMLAAVLTAGVAGCSPASPDDVVTLRLSHVNSVEDPWQTTSLEFAELVAEKTDGSVEVDVFPGGQLGEDRDAVEGMQIGSVDLSLVAGVLSSVEPSMTLLEVPYLFTSTQAQEQALAGPGGQELSAQLLDAGIRNLAWLNRGPRQLTMNRPITTPEELAGAKIRVPQIPASIDAWQAMGANPTPLAFGEVYGALQQGVIDGQENPLAIIHSANLAEVQSHVMLTNHVYGYVMLAMSERSWAQLTPEQQQALTESATEVQRSHNQRTAENEVTYRTELEEQGATFVDVDIDAFRAAVEPVTQRYADEFGRDLYNSLVAFNE